MPLAHAVAAKLAVGAAAAVVLAGGAATVAVRDDQGSGGGAGRRPGSSAAAEIVTDGSGTEVVIDPITGAVRVVPRPGGAGTAVVAQPHGAAGASGQPSAGAQLSGSGNGTVNRSGGSGARLAVGGGATGGPNGGSGGGGAAGGSGGGSGGGGGASAGGGGGIAVPSAPELSAPAVPSAPERTSTHAQGSFTAVVPGTDKVSKKLCLSGDVGNRCQTITVPALRPVELTMSFTGNAGASAPTFTPGSCPGGASITVAGLTPGATVKVTANGRQLSATVPERGGSQTASLCDA
jgi:hypothetical protein